MKQQQSILQWATLMLQQDVRSLSAIQDVKFIKHLLWKIDGAYFGQWEGGKGTQSFAQVIDQVGRYFQQQIGTDIKQFIESLNVYKQPMDLWELLLGIAIKGGNRGQNITFILNMDHNVQAELVGIVSGIIDKFGQESANSKAKQDVEKEEFEEPMNEKELLMNLLRENEQLTFHMSQTQTELQKEKLEIVNLLASKRELEQQIFMYKLEKASFLQTLANGNRSNSRIFDDGQETILQTGNLTQLANDIIIFVRDLRRKVHQQMEKNSNLEQELRQTKQEAAQTAEENQAYFKQLSYLNVYEEQINQLRQEINEVFNQNTVLIDKINDLEQEKAKLVFNLYKRNEENPGQAQGNPPNLEQISQRRRGRRFDSQNQDEAESSELITEHNQLYKSQSAESDTQKNKVKDQLKQPKLRIKLQRQIEYLKTSNQSLKRQNSSLKIANQNLQQTARQFLVSNEAIVKTWEQDFKLLMAHINQMGEIQPEIAEQEDQQEVVEIVQQLELQTAEVQIQHDPQNYQERQSEDQREAERARLYENQKQKARDLQNKLDSITQEMAKQKQSKRNQQNEVDLWREIASKLKKLVGRFRQNEINYQNTIYSLKMENAQLAKSLSQNQQRPAAESIRKLQPKVSVEQQIQRQQGLSKVLSNGSLRFKLQPVNRQSQYRSSQQKIGGGLSYLSIKQGQELDEDMIIKRNTDHSRFYKGVSRIVHQINQNQQEGQLQYLNLNRRLFSESKASLFNIKSQVFNNDIAKNAELQFRFQNEIKKMEEQYSWLNSHYQQLFRKLNIYSDQLKMKQYAKLEGIKLLQELQHSQDQMLQARQSEVVKLTEVNRQLRSELIEQAAKKKQLMQQIRQIQTFCQQFMRNKENNYEVGLKKMILSLQDMKANFSCSMKGPMEFLQLSIEGNTAGKAEQFYKLYAKEKEKNRKLHTELELLASTLLQYRNIIQF